jgi:hypothetical protein
MKTIMNTFTSAKLFIYLILLFSSYQNANCQNKESVNMLTQLSQRAKTNTGGLPSETFEKDVESFNMLVKETAFRPNFDAPVDIKVEVTDGAASIIATTEFAVAILRSEGTKQLNLKTSNSPAIVAIELFWEKLNKAIDPNWKMLFVTANVRPAPGTPNAAAGMNPDAIADPLLKKKYLDLIKTNRDNNLKNGQQRALRESRDKFLKAVAELVSTSGEGWNKTDVVVRFCKDEESKKILETHLKQCE